MRFDNNDPEFLKKRAEAFKQAKDDSSGGNRDYIFKERVPLFTPRDNENIIRVLPSPDKTAYFPWVSAFIHYQIGANGSQFLCPAKMNNQPCPICEEAKRMADNNVEQEKIRPLYAQHRAIAWIVDRMDMDKGPQIWVMPYKNIAQQIVKISFKRNGELINVDRVEDGWDIMFSKEGKGITTKYTGLRKDDEPSRLHSNPEVAEKWLQHVEEKSLANLIQFKPYDHIKAVLHGTLPMEDDEKPIISASTKKESKPKESAKSHSDEAALLSSLKAMNREQLETFVDSRDDLDINPDDWESDETLVEAIALELNLS